MAGAVYLEKFRQLLLGLGYFSKDQVEGIVRAARGYAGGVAKKAKSFPYSRLEQLPSSVKDNLPEDAQKVWMAAFNGTIREDGSNEEQAFRVAWAAVKQAGWKQEGDNWVKAVEQDMGEILERMEANVLNEVSFLAEMTERGDEAEVQIFPGVGTYKHPRYGDIKVTREFLDRVKKNFDGKVYQQDLPVSVDLEHESKLSGANAWIKDVEVKGEDGMWATLGFTDRGKELVKDGRFRYFSPEFYDSWTDPADGKKYEDLLIGGALTNRPFFKGMQSIMMDESGVYVLSEAMAEVTKTEDGMQFPAEAYLVCPDKEKPSTWKLPIWESPQKKVTRTQLGRAAAAFSPGGFRGQKVQLSPEERKSALAKLRGLYADMGVKPDELPSYIRTSMVESEEADIVSVLNEMGYETGGETMGMTDEEARQFAEVQAKAEEQARQMAELSAAKASLETEVKRLTEESASMRRESRRREFAEFVRENRYAFQGEVDEVVPRIEKLADQLDEETFKDYLEERKALSERIKDSDLFKQVSNDNAPKAGDEFDQAVDSLVKGGLNVGEATAKVASEHPDWYVRKDKAHKNRARGGA